MFIVSSHTAHLLWITLDVEIAGPMGGKHIHLLWMLMFLKEYCNQDSLSSICHVTRKTFHHWVDIFLDRISNLNLVSLSCYMFDCWFYVSFDHLTLIYICYYIDSV